VLLKKEAGIEKGSPTSNRQKVGKVTRAQLRQDRRAQDAGLERQRHRGGDEHGAGTARSMGSRWWTDADARQTLPRGVGTIEPRKLYPPREAVERVKTAGYAKFDESVDVAVRLGVDPKHADQVVRGTVSLPNGTGKKVRVLVIAQGDKAKEAEAAGADFVGVEYIQKIKDGGSTPT